MNKKICGIYKITNIMNGHVYIGQSREIHKRWIEHKTTFKSKTKGTILYKAMQKYGFENFVFEIIEECQPKDLDKREIYYIKEYNSYAFNEPRCGYNMTKGGDGQNGWGKKVCQYSLDGNYIKTFDSMVEAERELGFSRGGITNCCSHRRNSLGGYMWQFEGEEPPKPYINPKEKSVCQYDLDGNFIRTFKSITDASIFLGCNKTQISECCRLEDKSCFGYQWRFENGNPPQKKRYKSKKNVPILQLSLDGIIIKRYETANDAANELNLSKGYIYSCCKKGGVGAKGYIWKYDI